MWDDGVQQELGNIGDCVVLSWYSFDASEICIYKCEYIQVMHWIAASASVSVDYPHVQKSASASSFTF